jgi:hypothetical protein
MPDIAVRWLSSGPFQLTRANLDWHEAGAYLGPIESHHAVVVEGQQVDAMPSNRCAVGIGKALVDGQGDLTACNQQSRLAEFATNLLAASLGIARWWSVYGRRERFNVPRSGARDGAR